MNIGRLLERGLDISPTALPRERDTDIDALRHACFSLPAHIAPPTLLADQGEGSIVLDDVTSDTVDATHMRRRVDDWEERLNGLYATNGDWLPDGWEARPGAPVVMHEPLMRKFGMDAKPMPTLELRDHDGHAARVEPRGLWIIGSNGRVDPKGGSQRCLIVDMAENFEAPDGQVARAEQRCDREAVTRGWLRRALQ